MKTSNKITSNFCQTIIVTHFKKHSKIINIFTHTDLINDPKEKIKHCFYFVHSSCSDNYI